MSQKLSVTETSFFSPFFFKFLTKKNLVGENLLKKIVFFFFSYHRNKFLSQFLSKKHTFVTEKCFGGRNIFSHDQKFLSEKKVLSQKQVDRIILHKT